MICLRAIQAKRKMLPIILYMLYNVVRHYTSAGSRPTKGRTASEANRVHSPEVHVQCT